MRFYKVLPDITKTKHMRLWHKALRAQWSAVDLDWSRPLRIRSSRLKDQLARVLTPILMGEQAALYSVSGLVGVLGQRSEFESQLYLTTWAVDEGRHTELFTLFYHRLDREPMSIRRFPSGYLFQSHIVSKEPKEWLSGVLVSEVLAKLVMQEFERLDLDPLLSDIAHGVLKDEARHLGFNHIYVEDRFRSIFRGSGEGTEDGDDSPSAAAPAWKRRAARSDGEDPERVAASLHARLDKVLSFVPPILDALDGETREIGIDREELFGRLGEESRWRLTRAIQGGRRIAAGEAEVSDPSEAERIGA